MRDVDEYEVTRDCPRCSATAGTMCTTKFGNIAEWSHLDRRPKEDRYSLRYRGVRMRALCCECGTLRTVAARFWRTKDDNCTSDGVRADRQGRGWRCTQTLKCATCRTDTRHATLRDELDPSVRDSLEAEMMGWTSRWNRLNGRSV